MAAAGAAVSGRLLMEEITGREVMIMLAVIGLIAIVSLYLFG